MKYLIKAIKVGGQRAKSINQATSWKRAEAVAIQSFATKKYSKIIIERSNVVKVYTNKSKEIK